MQQTLIKVFKEITMKIESQLFLILIDRLKVKLTLKTGLNATFLRYTMGMVVLNARIF